MANIQSEQITLSLNIVDSEDQPLTKAQMVEVLYNALGRDNCSFIDVHGSKVFCYEWDGQKTILLFKAVTYLGGTGQHPVFKKRIQLSAKWKEIVNNSPYNVKFIGIYHFEGNIIFADFDKETYILRKMNNSSAFIYTNDLYQAMKNGIFRREDLKGNIRTSVKYTRFKAYLDGRYLYNPIDKLLSLFTSFNSCFPFGSDLKAKTAITEMYNNNWKNWKQVEWPGWFLEYLVDKYIKDNRLENQILYIGSDRKGDNELDFDLWFDEAQFHGDLKSSDERMNYAPGNDQDSFVEVVNMYDRFWYVVYEHSTIKDKNMPGYPATKFRTNFMRTNGEWPDGKRWDELSYHKRMKYSVNYQRMFIIELNRANFRDVLMNFNQGRQHNGTSRKPKFKISKKNIENFIIFSYSPINY